MSITQRFQRVGDLAADTMVIVEERAWQPQLFKIDDSRANALAEYIPADFVVPLSMAKALSLYVAKRSTLPLSRRHELAKHLADPLIAKFGFMADTSPDLMLCALYLHAFYSSNLRKDGPRTNLSPLKSAASNGYMASPQGSSYPSTKSAGGIWDQLDTNSMTSSSSQSSSGGAL
jgi:hypothetical protein